MSGNQKTKHTKKRPAEVLKKLEAHPTCGGQGDVIFDYFNALDKRYYVKCQKCRKNAPSAATRNEAVHLWNHNKHKVLSLV